MDFWAQHKDFILKVLAGVGVFLVALIVRGMTYGDELQKEESTNQQLARKVKMLKIAPLPQIEATEKDTEALEKDAETITEQIGFDLGKDGLQMDLLKRMVGYTRRYRDNVDQEAQRHRDALQQDLDGGFGQLRLMLRQELSEEASEKNIQLPGIGFENVLEVDEGEVLKYLLQLELAARVVRYAIDAPVDAVTDLTITTKQREVAIPDANPDFLQEYAVKVALRGSQASIANILNRLEEELPRVPLQKLQITRVTRPADRIDVDLTLLAVAADPRVPFAAPEKKE